MKRKAAVAGLFYPDSQEGIESQIESFDTAGITPEEAYGAVAPHAGYKYSGPVAARVYAGLSIPGSVLLIGPNHGSGKGTMGPTCAIMAEGAWETPLGELAIDEKLAERLMANTPLMTDAGWAHENEHSLEVQAPFLAHFCGAPPIVPVIMTGMTEEDFMALTDGIYNTVAQCDYPVTLIASTDFSHYVPQGTAVDLDSKAIERIEELDGKGLIKVVRENRISMCGAIPTAIVIEVCRRLGARKADLISYRTSGDVTGDYSAVVGYGGIVIRK